MRVFKARVAILAQGRPSKLCHIMFSLSLYTLAVRHYPHLFMYIVQLSQFCTLFPFLNDACSKLVDIIKTLYSSTHSVVRVNGTISEAFSISSGVRQGCVLAANLFNTATDRILNNTTQAMTLGVNYDDSGQLITDLDYADDIVIFADLLDTLKDALFIFNEQSQKTGATRQLVQDQASVLQPMDTHSTINTHRNTTCHNDRQLHIPWQHHRQ